MTTPLKIVSRATRRQEFVHAFAIWYTTGFKSSQSSVSYKSLYITAWNLDINLMFILISEFSGTLRFYIVLIDKELLTLRRIEGFFRQWLAVQEWLILDCSTLLNVLEARRLQQHLCENLKSRISRTPVAQKPVSGVGCLIDEVSRPRKIRHEHRTGLFWSSSQLVKKAITYATHNKHARQTSIPSMGIEPVTPAIKRFQTST
jgi:hypothetical protein